MIQSDEWEEWREIYARLPRGERREIYWDAVHKIIRRRTGRLGPLPGHAGDRSANSRASSHTSSRTNSGAIYAWQSLRYFLSAFPSGVALLHGVLTLLLLGLLPPAPHTPPALLAITYLLSLVTAVWLWWGARWVWQRAL